MLPLLSLFFPGGTALNLPFDINDLDDAFGAFNVLPGGQLVLQQIGQYPFANQSVAANAVIREPLNLSVIMDTPMRGPNAWVIKQAVFTALKATLENHNNSGGMYTIATPAYIYDNMVMLSLTDSSRGNNSLPQNAWRFDFQRPLVSLQDAQGALSLLAGQLSGGLPTTGAPTGTQIPAESAQPQSQRTFPGVSAALAGGPPALTSSVVPGLNYPAMANASRFPFAGIS
jgi:hypothetical protein